MILVLTMLMTMFVGLGSAFASSTATVNGEMPVATPGGAFNVDVMVAINEFTLTPAATYDFRITLPSGYSVVGANAAAREAAIDANLPVGTQAENAVDITTLGATLAATEISTTAYKIDFQTDLAGPNVHKKGRIKLNFAVNVPAGASGDVKLGIEAAPGSPITSQQVVVAHVGTGKCDVTLADVNIITSANTPATNTIETLRVKEDRAGALLNGANSLTLKLPVGMTWDISAVPGFGAGVAPAAIVWGTKTAQVSLTDADRTLNISGTGGAGTVSYWEITGVQVILDESIARTGDVVARVAGRTGTSLNDLVVAKYGEFKINVEAIGDTKQVVAGKWGQEIGAFAIKEEIGGSLVPNRTITLELSGNQIWQLPSNPADATDPLVQFNAAGVLTYAPPAIDLTKSKNVPGFAAGVAGTIWTPVGTSGKIIRATVTGATLPNDPAYLVFHQAELVVAPTAAREGNISITVGGTAGASGEVAVATVIPSVTGKVEQINDLRIGVQNQKLDPMIITELVDEAIDSRVVAGTGLNRLWLIFPQGVVPSVSTLKATVLEGDMQINAKAAGVQKRDDGRWFVDIPVLSTSMTPAKIKIENIDVSLDRTVAEGDITIAITGPAVNQTTHQRWFPGDIAVGSFVAAKAITPAPSDIAGDPSVEFRIDSNIYYVDGKAMVMDAAPYISNGRTFLPIRYVAYALGLGDDDIVWDSAARTVTVNMGEDKVELTIGSSTMYVNGEAVVMDVAPEITNDRTMLPIRAIAEAFGRSVGWDNSTKTVLIN